MQNSNIYLHEIATAVSEPFSQDFALDFWLKYQGDTEVKRNFIKRVYAGSAINKRHSVIKDWQNEKIKPNLKTKERNDLFLKESNRLSLEATRDLLKKLGPFNKERITHLITVSCTGFGAPGFDFNIIKEVRLSRSIERYHLGFMGCYAALSALKMARNICQANSVAKVLIVNVELCSVHFQKSFDPEKVVANAIFSDGVSAALVSADKSDSKGKKILLNSFNSTYADNSEDEMAWKIGDYGFDMKLSVYVPDIIKKNILSIFEQLFENLKITKPDIDIWAIHPGGKTVLEKTEEAMGISKDQLAISYDVLREYGNMSSTTIMFVLEKILGQKGEGKIFSAAFGPGLTIESGYFELIGDSR